LANKRLALRAAAGLLALGVLFFLYAKTQDYDARRESEVLGQLLNAKAIDIRWDIAVAEARADMAPRATAVQPDDLEKIDLALDAAARDIPTRVMQVTVADLKRAYAVKAELVRQYVPAAEDARQALAAAMRADALTGTQVRAAWREFPQRERLVAAENLVARALAEAQAYNRTPTTEHRAALQTYAADLARLHDLPRPIEATLSRLEADIHRLLLLKPLVQTMDGRFATLATGGYMEELTALVQRKQLDGVTSRAKYRGYLAAYLFLVCIAGMYAGVRLLRRDRALKERCASAEAALAHAPTAHVDAESHARRAVRPPAEVVDIVVRPYRVL
jgi:hypothetical protein